MTRTQTIFSNFPAIKFAPGRNFVWSPRQKKVFYNPDRMDTKQGLMELIHEIGHAQLNHQSYNYDIELLNMEVAAWEQAELIGRELNIKLDQQHIDDYLETYRLWLYKRSRCPTCSATSLQQTSSTYCCFICNTSWHVAQTRTLQPRRMRPVGNRK